MRPLRELPTREAADQLRDALDDAGISCELVANDDGATAVWVIDEEHNAQARALAARWLDADPDREAYASAIRRGAARREMKQRVAQRAELQRAALEAQLRAMMRPRPTPLTWGLLALSIAVAALTQLAFSSSMPFVSVRPADDFVPMIAGLLFADPYHYVPTHELTLGPISLTWLGLPWSQPWRLLTPVLVHFGFLHILFNALWLRDLGRVIEARHGSLYLGGFVVVSGVLSNVAQFEITESPMFGGLSGVVYGLLGLIWLGGRLRPRLGYGLTRATVQFMLLWLAMGFLGDFGVANYCHLGGLVVGMGWAYAAFLVDRWRSPR